MTEASAADQTLPEKQDSEVIRPDLRTMTQREKDAMKRQHDLRVLIGRIAIARGEHINPDSIPLAELATYWGDTVPLGGTKDSREKRQEAAMDMVEYLEGESVSCIVLLPELVI